MSDITDSWLIVTIYHSLLSHNPHQAFTLRVMLEAATDRLLFEGHPDPPGCNQFAAYKATEYINASPDVRRTAGLGSSLPQEVERLFNCHMLRQSHITPVCPGQVYLKLKGDLKDLILTFRMRVSRGIVIIAVPGGLGASTCTSAGLIMCASAGLIMRENDYRKSLLA
jgi:hypothetical protein